MPRSWVALPLVALETVQVRETMSNGRTTLRTNFAFGVLAPAHFMVDRFSSFDEPVTIEPPAD